jgi:3-deoxy-7-phosphoheptulonate synthase
MIPFTPKDSTPKNLLVSREHQSSATVVAVGETLFGGEEFPVIAGPCAVESAHQLLKTASGVCLSGARGLRGGAFKPRTSPYSFPGLEEEGLQLLALAREKTGLPVFTEVMSELQVELVSQYADVLQIGARNMQNYPLLRAVGRQRRPVLLKRGMAATLKEFLLAAEYILAEGNPHVILCERGIRTFGQDTRNTLDISAIPILKERTHLPVIVDPSHACGLSEVVPHLAKAALAVGADGLIVEVHHQPSLALSDGRQSLDLPAFHDMMVSLRALAPAMQRKVYTTMSPLRATG